MPDYRETIIRLDHGLKIAEIWTQDAALKRRLAACGAKQLEKQNLGEWFELPYDRVRLLKPRRAVSAKKSQELQAILAKARQSKRDPASSA